MASGYKTQFVCSHRYLDLTYGRHKFTVDR